MSNYVSDCITKLLDDDAAEEQAVAALRSLSLSEDEILKSLYDGHLLWYFASRCDRGDIGPQELMRRWPTCAALIAELYPEEFVG